MQITMSDYEDMQNRKCPAMFADDTLERKILRKRFCRETVLYRLGKIPRDEEEWRWRQALICSSYFTEEEIRNCFSDVHTRVRRLVAKDISQLTARKWTDNEAWLLKLLRQAGFSLSAYLAARQGGDSPAIISKKALTDDSQKRNVFDNE